MGKTDPNLGKQNGTQPRIMLYSFLHLKIAFYVIFASLSFYLTAIFNKYLLIKLDELSIFISTRLFLVDHLKEPAGMLSYLSAFVTQFFYYPWLGGAIFVVLLIVVQHLSVKVFKIPEKFYLLSFIPSAALLLLVTQLDYVIYEFIANGYAYLNLLGVLATYGSLWVYRSIKLAWLKILFASFYLLLFYPFLGFYALLSILLIILFEIYALLRIDKNKIRIIALAILLITSMVVPLYYYFNVYQVTFKSLYLAGLPEFELNRNELFFWLPLFILNLSVLFFSIQPFFKKWVIKKMYSKLISLIVALLVLFVVYVFSNKDENFHGELAIDNALFENDWNEVLEIEKCLENEPSKYVVMSTRLALQKMNIAGDLMFTRKEGRKKPKSRRVLSLWSYAAQPLFFHYGMAYDCYRWSMEDMARFGPKVQYLRYMVKCAIMNNELALAEKYNATLKNTLFHKKWAKKYAKYIENPNLVSSDPEIKANLLLYSFPDKLVTDFGSLNEYILNRLIAIKGGNLELLELSMQSFMLLKDADNFWPYFSLYIAKHDKIPVHYQEAALFFAHKNKNFDISAIKFDDAIVKKFYEAHDNIPEKKVQEYFKTNYSNTYWYYLYYGKL